MEPFKACQECKRAQVYDPDGLMLALCPHHKKAFRYLSHGARCEDQMKCYNEMRKNIFVMEEFISFVDTYTKEEQCPMEELRYDVDWAFWRRLVDLHADGSSNEKQESQSEAFHGTRTPTIKPSCRRPSRTLPPLAQPSPTQDTKKGPL